MTISLHSPEAYSPVGWKIIQDSHNLAENTKLKRWHVHHIAIALLEQSEGQSVGFLESLEANVGGAVVFLREFVDGLDQLWEQQAERIAELLGDPPDNLYGQMVTPTYSLARLETEAKSVMNQQEEARISSLHLLMALTGFKPVGYEDNLTLLILAAFGISNEAVKSALQNQA